MKLVLMSDLHGMLPQEPPPGDAVIIAGDVCPDIYKGGKWQLAWMNEVFAPWVTKHYSEQEVFLTWGNHDFLGQRLPVDTILDQLPKNLYIAIDEWLDVLNKKVWFSPWSPLFGGWAFMDIESRLADKYADIDEDTEILVSHSPPQGYGDLIDGKWFPDGQPVHVGSSALLYRIERLPNLELVVCGHIHEGRGRYTVERDAAHGQVIQVCDVLNVSCVDEAYNPVPDGPVVVEV